MTGKEKLQAIAYEITKFERECKRGDYTDTGDVWDLLLWIKKLARAS